MLEEVTTVESRQDVAMTLVKIYLGQGLVGPFLDYLNTREVHHTSKIKRMADCTVITIESGRQGTARNPRSEKNENWSCTTSKQTIKARELVSRGNKDSLET